MWHRLRLIYPCFVYGFLYIPIIVVMVFSFNQTNHSLLWHGFTYKWYIDLMHDTELLSIASHSIILGVCSASIATMMGSIAAISMFRYRFYTKNMLSNLLFLMVITPEIVVGVAMLLLYQILNIPLGFFSLLIAHVTLCLPFVAVTVHSYISVMDKTILEAARDLGANDLVILRRILIPLLMPAIIAGWLLSFTLSLEDVITSYFVAGPDYAILPLKIYSMAKLGINPEINALFSILLLFTIVLVIIANLTLRKKHAYENP